MKTWLKIIALSLLMAFLWVVGVIMAQSMLQVEVGESGDEGSSLLLLMLLCCLLQVLVLHGYLINTRLAIWERFWVVSAILVLLQFLLPQVESWFYLSENIMPLMLILATTLGGIFMSLVFALVTIFAYPDHNQTVKAPILPSTVKDLQVAFLTGVLLYPLIYFLAGYFIAWQNPDLRAYYSGDRELISFFQIMQKNFLSGSVLLQTIRGVIWALLGVSLIKSLSEVSRNKQYRIIGVLFAVISSAQLLLPNPYMPESVRWSHLLELLVSTSIWGILLVWVYSRLTPRENVLAESKM